MKKKSKKAVKKNNLKVFAIVAVIVILAVAAGFCILKKGTNQESNLNSPTLEEYTAILENNNDYQEYKSNFFNQFNRYPEFTMVENVNLDKETISKKLEGLGGSPYAMLYQDLPESDLLYLVKLQEKSETNRGLVSVIDIQ